MCICSPLSVSLTRLKAVSSLTCLHVIILVYRMCKAKLFSSAACVQGLTLLMLIHFDWLDIFIVNCLFWPILLFQVVFLFYFCFMLNNYKGCLLQVDENHKRALGWMYLSVESINHSAILNRRKTNYPKITYQVGQHVQNTWIVQYYFIILGYRHK